MSSVKILKPDLHVPLAGIRHALFDFDGTLSVLREGWESVMIPVMLQAISGSLEPLAEVEHEVRQYVEQSTGILTILQMEWLVDAVRRHGLAGDPLTAAGYKQIYLARLMGAVRERIAQIEQKACSPDDFTVSGARRFLEILQARGVRLYLVSGTDHADVQREAQVLELAHFFAGHIYGALDDREAHSKDRIIRRILEDNGLSGRELLVVGDGPVEMREACARGAVALGVASNEIARSGWDERKIRRLEQAGADLLIPDFNQAEQILDPLR